MKLVNNICRTSLVWLFIFVLLPIHRLFAVEIEDLQIVPKVVLDTNGYGVDIALNETDKSLHVAWVRDGDLYYSYRNVTGNWTSPEQIPDGGIVLYGQDDHGNQGTCSTIAASPD